MNVAQPVRGVALAAAVVILTTTAQAWAQFDAFFSDSTGAEAAKADVSGLLYDRFDYRLTQKGNAPTVFLHTVRFRPVITYERGPWSALGSLDARQQFQFDKPLFKKAGIHSLVGVEPHEFYFTYGADDWSLRVGQQIITWGRGAVSLMDTVNPPDLSEFIFIEDEFGRLPVSMLNFSYYIGQTRIQAIYAPFYRPARPPMPYSDFWPYNTPALAGRTDFLKLEQATLYNKNVSESFPGAQDLPPDDFVHGEPGLALTTSAAGFDFGGYYSYAWEKVPVPHFTPAFLKYLRTRPFGPLSAFSSPNLTEIAAVGKLYTQRPSRQSIAGLSVGRAVWELVVRAEAQYMSSQSLYDLDFNVVRPPAVNLLLAVERLASERLVVSLNMLVNKFLTDDDLFQMRRTHYLSVFGLHVQPFDFPIWLEARGIFNWTLEDQVYSGFLGYRIQDGLQVHAGIGMLEGDKATDTRVQMTPFAVYDRADHLFARLRWSF